MRILLLTQWYPPEPSRLWADLAKGLQIQGHDVRVITGFPNWPTGRLYPGYRLRLWQKEVLDGLPVTRVILYPSHDTSALRRIFNIGSFAAAVSLFGFWLARKPDVIYAIPPPTVGWAGWFLSRLWRVPLVYEVQDMWPESLRAAGLVRNSRALKFIGWFTGRVYVQATAIRVISPGFRQNLIQKGVQPGKIHCISNWVNTEFYRPVPPNPERAAELGFTGRFNLLYAGVIGLSQGLDTVLEAAARLQDLPAVKFHLAGDGTELPRLKAMAQQRGLSNVQFLGSFPTEEMPGLYALAEVLLVHLRADPLLSITIPHKIFTCMASGKPLLAALEGDAAEVITSANAGLTCKPGEAEQLAQTVRRMHALPPNELVRMGANARDAACRLYQRDYLVNKIAQMVGTAVEQQNLVR